MTDVLETPPVVDAPARPVAVSVRGRPVRRAPLRWLPWAALGLAAAVGLAMLGLALVAAGEEAGLTADGRPVRPEGLGSLAGRTVEGRDVRVESVVPDEGFWVGDSAEQRVFVALDDDVEVEPGDTVDLEAVVRPNPADVADLGVAPAQGAEQLRAQGHHLEASEVEVSG